MGELDKNLLRDSEIQNIKKWKKECLIIYFSTFVLFGSFVSSFGPAIIELSQELDIPKTSFAPMFTFRGIGFVVGSYFTGYCDGKIDLHKIYFMGSVIYAICGLCISMGYGLNFLIFIAFCFGFGNGIYDVLANQLMVLIKKGENLGPWMQFLHFGFGIGAVTSPVLVSYIGYKYAFYILIAGVLIVSYPLTYLRCPNNNEVAVHHENNENDQEHQHLDYIEAPFKIVIILCLILLFYVGAELGFGGWVATFTSLKHILQGPEAAFSSSVFWFGLTVGRFSAIYLTKFLNTKFYLQLDLFGCCIVSIVFSILPVTVSSVYICSFLFGFTMSSIFPLVVSLPSYMKMELSGKNTAILMIGASFGELIVPIVQGYLMDINANNFMYTFVFLSFVQLLLFQYSVNISDSINNQRSINHFNKMENQQEKQQIELSNLP